MRSNLLSLLLFTAGCGPDAALQSPYAEPDTAPRRPYANLDTNWAPRLGGTTQHGPVQGHLTVFAYDGAYPISGLHVILQFAAGRQLDILTNDSGRADFRDPDLFGPMNLHFLHDGYHRRSWIGVNAQIITVAMHLIPQPSDGSSSINSPPKNLSATIHGMDQLPASNDQEVRFAHVSNRLVGFVARSSSVFEQSPGRELAAEISYDPNYLLNLVAIGGITSRDSVDNRIAWEDVLRVGIGNSTDPEAPQAVELTHALDQLFEIEFRESQQLVSDGLMESWQASVTVKENSTYTIGISASQTDELTQTANVPRLDGAFGSATYEPSVWGRAPTGVFKAQLIGADPLKRTVGRFVLPRDRVQIRGDTIEMSSPLRPVDLTTIYIRSERSYWKIDMFEQRDQVVLPFDPGPHSRRWSFSDYCLSGFDVGHFNGDAAPRYECLAETHAQ